MAYLNAGTTAPVKIVTKTKIVPAKPIVSKNSKSPFSLKTILILGGVGVAGFFGYKLLKKKKLA